MNSKEIVGSVFAVALKIIIAVILIMLVYKYAIQGYEYGYRIFGEPAMTTGEGRTVTITVNEGDSVKKIAQTLETNGLVREAKLFELQEKISEYKNMLQPGVYELNTSMTAEEMIEYDVKNRLLWQRNHKARRVHRIIQWNRKQKAWRVLWQQKVSKQRKKNDCR